MYYDRYGNSYKYIDISPNGTKVYHNGLILGEEKKKKIDNIISRTWDNLSDGKKIEINKKVEKIRSVENRKK